MGNPDDSNAPDGKGRSYLATWIGVGMALGILGGMVFEQPGVGAAIGLAVGYVVGTRIDAKNGR